MVDTAARIRGHALPFAVDDGAAIHRKSGAALAPAQVGGLKRFGGFDSDAFEPIDQPVSVLIDVLLFAGGQQLAKVHLLHVSTERRTAVGVSGGNGELLAGNPETFPDAVEQSLAQRFWNSE